MRRLIVLLVAGALLAAACNESPEGKYGERLYGISCAGCHADDLGGMTILGPDIGAGSNTHLNLSDEQIAGVIVVGPGSMPGYGSSLDDDQIESLVVYLRSIQGG